MADRSIVVRLRAEVAGFKAAMDDAARSTRKVGEESSRATTSLGRMVDSANRNRQAWTTSGTAVAAFGAAVVGGLGLAARSAIQWESAWTGVTKTVDGSTGQMAVLEEELRSMARTLPATHDEIAAVAEAAGQLGVQRESIASFTRTMVDLSKTTNLSADEAATSIAQLMNIMQTAPDDVDNLGAAVVALGNAGASTERDIVQMGQRIAGAGKIVGLSEGQVLGLANALASTGIEVEAGGSAVSNIMIDISKAVSSGSDDLQTWASLAGMSAQQFAQAWSSDPADALASMIEGLGRMNAAGGDVFGTLETLGQSDIRVTRALLAMAGSGDLLRQSLELGNQAWKDNTALVEEAAKRYETTEAKIQIAKNAINDSAIDIGENMLPAIAGLAEGVAGLAKWFGDLPTPLQQAGTALAGIVGATSLAGGGFLLLFPRIMDTVQALRTLSADGSKIPGVLGKVSKAAGVAAAAMTAMYMVGQAQQSAVLTAGVGETTKALLDLADGAENAEDAVYSLLFAGKGGASDVFWGNDIKDAQEALKWLTSMDVGMRLDDVTSRIVSLGNRGATSWEQAKAGFESVDKALESLVQSGNADKAARAVESLGISSDDAAKVLPGYLDALAQVDVQQKLTGGSADSMAGAVDQVDPAVQAAADALAQWRDMVSASFGSFIDLGAAYQGVIDKNSELANSSATATGSSSDSWQDFYDGQTVSATDYIAELQAQVDAQARWRDNMLELTRRTQVGMTGDMRLAAEGMINELLALGPEGAAQVALLASMSDTELASVVSLYKQKGADAANGFTNELNAMKPPTITVNADTGPAYRELMNLQAWMRRNIDPRVRIATGAGGSGGLTYATGGEITGGIEGRDSVPIMAMPREWVIRTAAVDSVERVRPGFMSDLNRRGADALHMADGGQVGYSRPMFSPWSGVSAQTQRFVRGSEAGVTVNVDTIVAADPRAAVVELGHEMRFGFAGMSL